MSKSVEQSSVQKSDLAISQDLHEYTLEGKWGEVVNIYRDHPWTHKKKITTSEDTALHVAVDNGKTQVVIDLVKEIIKQGPAMKEKNVHGDTPLHLAASRGFALICLQIAEKDADLLTIRNDKGETPIFLAALNGHRHTFLCLHKMHTHHRLPDDIGTLTRDDGDTILHCAIRREHFDLAVIIVEFYKDVPLIQSVNRMGYSPLKMLATRPAAFKSRSNLRWLKYILYHCIHVDEDSVVTRAQSWSEEYIKEKDLVIDLPRNYLSCYNFIDLLLRLLCGCGWLPKIRQAADEENPDISESQHTPKNYSNGFQGLMDLKNMKEKHLLSVRLLNKFMENATDAYVESGNQPNLLNLLDETMGMDPLSNATKMNDSKETEEEKEKREIHALSVGLLNKLREKSSSASMGGGNQPIGSSSSDGVKLGDNLLSEGLLNAMRILRKKVEEDKKDTENEMVKKIIKKETALLIAAKNGIIEMVQKILHELPTTIHDTTLDNKNILLVAVENRQPHIIEELQKNDLWDILVFGVDNEENTVMHLAAKSSKYKTWQIAGSAMNMLWDIKWYQYVKSFAPKHFVFRENKEGKDPTQIFTDEHEQLIKKSSTWLKDTSESCSVVAALIAGVTFATSSSVPGGNNDQTGKPTLEGQPAFELFAITSLVALCFSVTALIMFLAVLTSRKEVEDFRRSLPLKLLLGLSSLFVSITSMLISFCAAHFFAVKDKFKEIVFPIYVATCLPITFYAVAQFPLYIDLLKSILTKVPQPRYKEDNL